MPTYTRIRLIDGKTFILRNAKRIPFLGNEAVSGIEVNKEADEISGAKFDQRTRLIQVSLIKRETELVMNNHYGMLAKK